MDFGLAAKQRPVLILAYPQPDDARALVVVAPLTSQLRGLRGEMDIGKPRWLPKHSAVNVQGIASIDQHALIRKLGKLSDEQLSAVKNAIRELLGFMAQETAGDGIQVFAIHPGSVRTPMNDYVHDSPEVTERAPQIQQWFRTLYSERRDTPIERSVDLVLRLAAGDADALSGRYLSVEDDLDALVKQFAAEPSEHRMLRLLGIAAISAE